LFKFIVQSLSFFFNSHLRFFRVPPIPAKPLRFQRYRVYRFLDSLRSKERRGDWQELCYNKFKQLTGEEENLNI